MEPFIHTLNLYKLNQILYLQRYGKVQERCDEPFRALKSGQRLIFLILPQPNTSRISDRTNENAQKQSREDPRKSIGKKNELSARKRSNISSHGHPLTGTPRIHLEKIRRGHKIRKPCRVRVDLLDRSARSASKRTTRGGFSEVRVAKILQPFL